MTCPVCSHVFEPRRHGQKYCSVECRGRRPSRLGNHRKERCCEICGELYRPTYAKQRTCGRRCGEALRRSVTGTLPVVPRPLPKPRKRSEPKYPAWRIFLPLCVVCGRRFATPHTVTTCSDRCRETKRLEDKREAKQRRRARQRDAFVAPVNRRRIFERDKWRCGLCGKAVKRGAIAPHPLSPTIDHVIPLAKGGTHEPANVQTAHYICNSRKSDSGGGEQLALVG